MSEESYLPPPKKNGWKWVLGVMLGLGVIGVSLSLIFRDYTTPEELKVRERRQNAEQVSIVVVFSNVDEAHRQRLVDEILGDIGADSSKTDLVIGATAVDPWAMSMTDYKQSILEATSKAKDLKPGKQTLVMSMIAGILTKTEIPARIYLVGSMNTDSLTPGVISRTAQTADAFGIRDNIMAPIEMVSYMDTSRRANAEYVRIFGNRSFPLTQRDPAPLTLQ